MQAKRDYMKKVTPEQRRKWNQARNARKAKVDREAEEALAQQKEWGDLEEYSGFVQFCSGSANKL